MKRKIYLKALPLFCVLVFLSGYASHGHNESLANIDKIFVQPERLNTKIILESSSPPLVSNTHYSQITPLTIVINLDKIKALKEPQIIQGESSLVKKIDVKKTGDNQFRLSIGLRERVPYRIYSGPDSTIVELNQIQRFQEGYIVDPEIKAQLEKDSKGEILLKEINVSEEKDRIDIAAKLSGKVITQVFAIDNPLRLVIDLFDTVSANSSSEQYIQKLGVEKVRTGQFQKNNPYTISRIVLDLTEAQFYALNSGKEELMISFFNNNDPFQIESEPSPLPTENPEPIIIKEKTSPEKPEEIKEVMIEEDTKETPPPKKAELPEKKEVPEKIELPEKLSPTKDLRVPQLNSEEKEDPKDNKATSTKREDPDPVQPAEELSFQEQERTDQFKPKTLVESETKYKGEIIGQLKFKDADLRDVVLYLGDFAGLNVVFDPDVSGTVTCDLRDVPWDQALDIVLRINKMGMVIEGNVLRIAPIQALTREEDDRRKLEESRELAGAIEVKYFQLSYSKASDVKALLQSKLSNRGEIIVDNRTNTLVISDVAERIKLQEKLIFQFDTPTPQVSIEARIVEATSRFIRNLGIQWGFKGIADPFYGNQTSLQFPNKALVDGALIPQGIVTKGIGGPLGGYAVNLPAPAFATAIGLSFANVMDTFRLDVALSALETSGEGRIISSPTITTQNNQEAEIIQGRQIPVQTVANFTVTTRYQNAALQLKATPQITAEGTIIMTIDIRNDAPDFANLVNGIPPITTQSASTTVMISDGGTTVIGGIYRSEDSITRERVPFFHKIPILGNLFRSFARTKENRELLIFITPRIIK